VAGIAAETGAAIVAFLSWWSAVVSVSVTS